MDSRQMLEAARNGIQRAAAKLPARGVPGAIRWTLSAARRKLRLVVTFACVALLAAGITIVALPPHHRPAPPNAGIMAPGSQGSLSHTPWWDPRGWFGGSGAPSSHTLAGENLALPSNRQMPRQAAAPPAHRVRELTSKRSQYSRTYLLSNGQQQAVISTVPANYRTSAGQWAPIDTHITGSSLPGYALQNTTNSFRSYFGSKPGQLVRFEVPGGGWVSIGVSGARSTRVSAAGDEVTYSGIAPGVSLIYQVTPQALGEQIVLSSPQAAAAAGQLSFTMQLGGGLQPYLMRGGAIELSRLGPDAPELVIPAPVMTDERPVASSPYGRAWSPKVTQQVSWVAATSTLRVRVQPDMAWLSQPQREYPVVIDPTIEIAPTPSQAQNTFVESDLPTTNLSSSWRLSVGTNSASVARALLSFPLGTIPSGTQISSADLNLYYDQSFGPSTQNQTVNVYQATSAWNASTVTWNTAPGYSTEGDTQVMVDDSTTGSTSATGSWPSQASSSAINGEYVYNQDATTNDTFTWVPTLPESGSYQVQAHYVANTAAASNAPYTVYYNGGSKAYTVNQQSGSGGVWTTLGTQSFAAGTAGKVVLGDGPASSTVRVEADAVQFTKYASLSVNPNAGNIWDSYSVSNIVQSWLNGSATNDGFVVKAANESALNVGGPRYEGSGFFYNGEVATYPQLVVTYGLPSVTLNQITTINATGADLSWTPYVNPSPSVTGDNLAQYMVYRSVYQSFTPDASTLVSPVAAGTTSFDDTSAPPAPAGDTSGNAMYYMVAVQTQNGTIIPGPTELVRLPVAGSTVQIFDDTGATTLSSAQPTTNEEQLSGQPWVDVGDNSSTYGNTRSIFSFPSLSTQIPAGSTITDAHLKLWAWYNDNTGGGSGTYEAHELTQSFNAAQATWDNAASGTAWTTAGGAYNSTVASSVTGLTDDPNRQNWTVTSIAQDWLNTPADQHGLLLKLSGETSKDPQEREIFLNDSAQEASLRPELVVTYLDTTPDDTYYAPNLPYVMASNASFTTPVTLTNTTTSTWASTDWVLTYHWLTPDGTDVSTTADQAQTALPSAMAPGAQVTLNAAVTTPDTSASGSSRTGYSLEWDLFDKTTGTWLSSGTSTPTLDAAHRLQARPGGSSRVVAPPQQAVLTAAVLAAPSQTVAPLKQVTSVTRSASDLLGLENYYQYTGINTGSGSSLLNNDATGNVVWSYNAYSHPSNGFQTFVRMAYNSMDTSESSMGFGFSLQASTLTRLGTPLEFHPQSNPTTVTLTDGDGTSHEFAWNSSTSTWTSPAGFNYYLQQVASCTPNGESNIAKAWLLTAPDRTSFYFDCEGYETSQVDKNGNTGTFTYTSRKSENKPEEFLDYVTDPAGRQTLTISYYAKGQNYSYIDANGNVASGTNLTNPDIIDQIQSITDINGRTIEFLYNVQGETSQMIDGYGTSVAKTFKFAYDATQGNKNVKLVSVTDPRLNTTNLAYYTAPQDPTFKWSLETVTDRMTNSTGFAYTVPSGGGIQTVVTDPLGNASTYLMDTSARPVQVTNAKSQVTSLIWDADNNVTSLKQDNGATTTWTWDQNTGLPLTMHDAQANANGTAGYTYTYSFGLNGHTADLTSELTPAQRLWTFGYDANGNLKSVTQPDGNASGATAGSYTSAYTYNTAGELLTTKDADGNTTTYSSYGPVGYPGTVTDALGHATSYGYDSIGDVLSTTDAVGDATTRSYDVFGRPGAETMPKSTGVTITTPAPTYDGNDNVTQTKTPDGAITSYTYNANDQATSQVAPADSSSAQLPTTTDTYDADGNLKTVTSPDGNVSGATAGSYTTTYAYDALNEKTSMTDAMGGVTKYGYDDVGNSTSVTSPNGNASTYTYDLNNKVTKVTNPAGGVSTTSYDLDGLPISQTDPNGNTILDTLDANGQLVQRETPAQAPGAATTYDITQYVYDQAGNQTQVLSPRAVAAGYSTTSSCVATATCPFTSVTKYNANGHVSAQVSAYNPSDPVYKTPSETDYTYDNAGRLFSVSAPPSGGQTIRNVTNYTYFQNSWVASTTDPSRVTTSYDYTNEGDQKLRTNTSAGGDMARSQSWTYYPAGTLATVTDNGVPTGLYSELVDNSDPGNTSSSGTWTHETTPSGFWGPDYQEDVKGTSSNSFTWNLHVPQTGSYAVYVWFPKVTGAVTNASYKVSYSGGSATVTENQTTNTGTWVKLGSWQLSSSATNQSVSVAGNSAGTVLADAIKVVRDDSGVTDTAHHDLTYQYDANGSQTLISDSSPGATTTSTTMAYDQLDRLTSETEAGSSGTLHTTTYGYDGDSDLTSRIHDAGLSSPSYAGYTYNNLDQMTQQSDGTSASDPSPQVTKFTSYTPDGQVATEIKPNGNTLTNTYFANNLLQQSQEKTPAGLTAAQNVYQYNPNGDMTSNAETVMSANDQSTITHTLTYTYDPMDRVQTVDTNGAQTESYVHDANNNVTSQSITSGSTTTSTTYTYDQNRLMQSSSGGVTDNYNYDTLGRLDTVTTPSSTTPLQSNTYDGFDNLTSQTTPSGTTSYTYDSLNRMTSQDTSGTTTNFSYLGLSSNLVTESQGTNVTKSYTYTPWNQRTSQAQHGTGGSLTYGYYTYNSHSDVEAVTGSTGNTTATYGYTAYGQPVSSMFTGQDKNNANPGPSVQPYSSYRFNSMRWDSSSGQYDMGFRNYNPGVNQFLTRDLYDGALQNMGLTADPFTGSQYAFGQGNPISNIELDGHMLCVAGGPCGSIQYLEHWSATQPAQPAQQSSGTGTGAAVSPGVAAGANYLNWATTGGSMGQAALSLKSVASIARSSKQILGTLNTIMLYRSYGIGAIKSGLQLEQLTTSYLKETTSFTNNFKGSFTSLFESGAAGNISRLGAGLSVVGGLTSAVGELAQTHGNVARSVAVGLGDTAGNLLGGAIGSATGAWVTGMAIGAAAGPAGMVVGALVGFGASWLINTGWNDFVNSSYGTDVGHALNSAANAVGSAASTVGNAIGSGISAVASWF